MNVFTELSQKNTYQPNLTSTQESCERTYRQAIRKLDKITQYYSNIDLSKLSEDGKWEFINKKEYLADINEKLEKTQVLNKRQIYILTVSALENYLGKELK